MLFYMIHNVFDMYCIENSDSIIIKTYQRKVREMKKGWMCSDENEIKLLTILNTNRSRCIVVRFVVVLYIEYTLLKYYSELELNFYVSRFVIGFLGRILKRTSFFYSTLCFMFPIYYINKQGNYLIKLMF